MLKSIAPKKLSTFLYAFLFSPISYLSYGVNYSYLILFALKKCSFRGVPNYIIVTLFYYVLCYLIGLLIFHNQGTYFLLRQFVSFCLYILPICVMCLEISIELEDLCKIVLLVSAIYALWVIVILVTHRHGFILTDAYHSIKGGLRGYIPNWPQRFTVLVVFAAVYSLNKISENFLYSLVFFLLVSTIFLSFTRSAYIAFFIGCISFFVATVLLDRDRLNLNYVILGALIIIMVAIGNGTIFETVLLQMVKGIIKPLSMILSNATPEQMHSEVGSTYVRLEIWSAVMTTIRQNPLTGSGFAGIYLFYPLFGSAHSQYMDVLLRTGIIGMLLFCFYYFQLLRLYLKINIGVFSGLIAIAVYGLFNETLKLTYIGLLIFLLFNIAVKQAEKFSLKVK